MNNLELLADSLEYIENHLQDNIRTEDIALACHCSKSTLEKLFHYINAISVHEYIIRRRMMLAAKMISGHPEASILDVAVEYGYNSNEAFTRAFRKVWNCNPSEFRNRKFVELFPRLRRPIGKGDAYFMQRRSVDISELYDLFVTRKDCCFVCCDIKNLTDMNQISRKTGDLGIIETMKRMEEACGDEDMVFRIGGDEFCILTNSTDEEYGKAVAERICGRNGEPFDCDGREIPLALWAVVTRVKGRHVRYNDLFTELHMAIENGKG